MAPANAERYRPLVLCPPRAKRGMIDGHVRAHQPTAERRKLLRGGMVVSHRTIPPLRPPWSASRAALALFALTPVRAQQTFTTFQAASVVVGQVDFTSQDLTSSQTVTAEPSSVAVSATGKMAIGGETGNRVLLWNSIPTTNGTPADVVVGQTDFTSTTAGCTNSLMNTSEGVAFSPDGSKLLVCDRGNNRVLIWNTVPTTNGQAADVVVGQTDFTSSLPGTSGTKLNGPSGVLVTPAGQMVITDNGNNRVLVYNSVPTTNGAAADSVIGQTLITANTSGGGKKGLTDPWQSAISGDGKLLVADSGNNRVLVYGSLSKANTIGADVVIGQVNFGQTGTGTSATQFFVPRGVAVSPDGQVAIGERANNRVLIYNSIPTSNQAAADVVLGQPDFDSSQTFIGGVSAQSMATVFQLAYAPNGRLLVSGNDMHRIMIFGVPDALPSVLTLPATLVVPTGAQLNGLVNPDGISTDVHFEYSTDPGLAGAVSTTTQNIGSGSVELPVTAPVTGLLPQTIYYFRVVASNTLGTYSGDILSFYTGVVNWGGSGTDASNGALDPSLIPTNGTQTFTNVNGQGYNIVVTTTNLGADGQGSYFGAPDWWLQGSAPGSDYSTVTFQFFDSVTNQPYALSGVDFRLLDAEINERFRDFGYWDANNNFVAVSNTSSLLTFSNTPVLHLTDGSVANSAPQEGGDQAGKWIELNLSDVPITGFTFEAHRETSSAGSVLMSNLISPWDAWRTTYFGPQPFPPSADDFADPDGDGNNNVFEYFFGTNPIVADSPNPLQMGIIANRLTLTFPRNTSATDTTATVQGADNPAGPWTDLARSINGAPFSPLVAGVPVSETGDGAILTVRVGDQYLATDPSHPTRFLRLQVSAFAQGPLVTPEAVDA